MSADMAPETRAALALAAQYGVTAETTDDALHEAAGRAFDDEEEELGALTEYDEFVRDLTDARAALRDAELLRRAIEASGMSARRFATEVLVRDERTIRRWLDATRPMPAVVRKRLEQIAGASAPPD